LVVPCGPAGRARVVDIIYPRVRAGGCKNDLFIRAQAIRKTKTARLNINLITGAQRVTVVGWPYVRLHVPLMSFRPGAAPNGKRLKIATDVRLRWGAGGRY